MIKITVVSKTIKKRKSRQLDNKVDFWNASNQILLYVTKDSKSEIYEYSLSQLEKSCYRKIKKCLYQPEFPGKLVAMADSSWISKALVFWPFNWNIRFNSPVRYWDPAHFGAEFMIFEIVLDVALIGFLLISNIKRLLSSWRRN